MKFNQTYAKVDDDNINSLSIDSRGEENLCKLTLSDKEFFDDSFIHQSPSDYGVLMNVTRLKEDTQKDGFLQSDVDDFLKDEIDAENYQMECLDEIDFAELESYKI